MRNVIRTRGRSLVAALALLGVAGLAWTRPFGAARAHVRAFPPADPEMVDHALACIGLGDVRPGVSALGDGELAELTVLLARLLAAYERADFSSFLALRAGDLAHATEALGGDWLAVLERDWRATYTEAPIARLRPEATRVELHREGMGGRDVAAWERSFDTFAGLAARPGTLHRPMVPHRRSIERVAADARPLAWIDVELAFETRDGADGGLCVRFVRDAAAGEWFLHRAATLGTTGAGRVAGSSSDRSRTSMTRPPDPVPDERTAAAHAVARPRPTTGRKSVRGGVVLLGLALCAAQLARRDRGPDGADACAPPAGSVDLARRLESVPLAEPSSTRASRSARAPGIRLGVRARTGAPIERFAVATIAERDARVLAFAAEEERPGGAFVVAAPAQAFRLEVRADGWLPARLGPFAPGALPEQLECRLDPAGGVRGIVSADGKVLAGARVALHEEVRTRVTYNGFPLRMRPGALRERETDAAGAFALSVESAGRYYLCVEHEDHAPAELGPLWLAPDERSEHCIELAAGGTVAVRVRSAAGASVAGTLVALSHGDGKAWTERAGVDGTVEFTHLASGDWQVELAEEEIDARFGATYESTQPAGAVPANCRVVAGEVARVDLWLEERDDEP